MREILFRGKREDTGEWVEGFYTELCPSCVYSFIENHDVACIVIPESVGQYTGLKDKNGVKIFEGDIIRCWRPYTNEEDLIESNSELGIVKYGFFNCGCCHGVYGYVFESLTEGLDSGYVDIRDCSLEEYMTCIVVGNIHDNPELIHYQEE